MNEMYAEDLPQYRELVTKYNVMKSEAIKKIQSLERELKNTKGIAKYTNDHVKKLMENLSVETDTRKKREKELKALSVELDKTRETIKTNEKLFEDAINKMIYSNKSALACSQSEGFNVKISELTGELKKITEALRICEEKNRLYVNELNEERIRSREKDRDLTKLARQLNNCYLELNETFSRLQTANERNSSLESELKCNKELSDRLNEVEEKLICVKRCLSAKTDEVECKNIKLDESRRINEDNDKIRKLLEDKIISEGEKLKESEESKNICELDCQNLIKENDSLKLENGLLSKNVEKLNYSLTGAREKEQYWRKNSETCAKNIKASIEEIENLNTEVKCVNDRLSDVEKTLKTTELKLTEETRQKEMFKERYYNVANKHEQRSEIETLSNAYKKLIEVHNTLCKRLEDLETMRSKNYVDEEKETLKRQLNKVTQQLNQNIKDRETEMKSTVRLFSEMMSREKIVKRHNATLRKIIEKNVKQFDTITEVIKDQFNYFNQRYGNNDKTSEQSQGRYRVVVEEKKKAPTIRNRVTSNNRLVTKSDTRCSSKAVMKTSSLNYDMKRSKRGVVPTGPAKEIEWKRRSNSAVDRNVKGDGPSDRRLEERTAIDGRVGGRGDLSWDDRNAIIVARLTRELDEKVKSDVK